MPKPSKFRAPRTLTSLTQVVKALFEIQDDLTAGSRSGYEMAILTGNFTPRADSYNRVSPPPAGMHAVMPPAGPENAASGIVFNIEHPEGNLIVDSAPGQLVNGAESNIFSVAGVLTFISNGTDAWNSTSQLPGTNGLPGATGSAGAPAAIFFPADGQDGNEGPQGVQGIQGPTGAQGPIFFAQDGQDGNEGPQGVQGRDGPAGATGPTGPAGSSQTGLMPLAFEPEDDEPAPAFFAPGWASALASNPRSGGNNGFVDVGQFINFGLDGPTTSSPQIRCGDTNFRIAGSTTELSGTASVRLLSSGGFAAITTGGVLRLTIASTGEWSFPAGSSGQVWTHQGAGAPPIWAAPAASGGGTFSNLQPFVFEDRDNDEPLPYIPKPGFAAALQHNPRSGASPAIIDLHRITAATPGPRISFGDPSVVSFAAGTGIIDSLSAGIQVQSGGFLGLNATGALGTSSATSWVATLNASAQMFQFATNASSTTCGVEVQAKAVAPQPSGASITKGGVYWVNDGGSSSAKCRAVFEDSDNGGPASHQTWPLDCTGQASQLTAGVVSAATTPLNTTAALTVGGGTLVVGSRFRCEFTIDFIRGATATVMNITYQFTIGGANLQAVVATPTTPAATYQARVIADFTILTVGAGGTAMGTISVFGSAAPAGGSASNVALAVNTGAALTLRGLVAMSAIVAGTSVRAMGGHIERLI